MSRSRTSAFTDLHLEIEVADGAAQNPGRANIGCHTWIPRKGAHRRISLENRHQKLWLGCGEFRY